ncbi:MAG: sigma-70 family RNA polymerase sigma factor [Vicinamibacterales bacterium]
MSDRGPRTFERFEFDEAYVDRLASGDAEAERHFTAYFGDLLTIKLRSRLRSPALVEDAKQETFLRVLTTLRKGGLASAGSLGAFVNSVCNNVLFETYRAETKRQQMVPEDTVQPEAPGSSAEETLVAEDDHAQLRDALRRLPDKDRQILRWLFFDERDKDEVCRTLGVDRPYLRVLVHRAKGRLRDALLAPPPGGPGTAETARGAGTLTQR